MDAAPRITAEELKRRMDDGEDIFVLDMRRGSWHRSDVKMKGAARIELADVPARIDELPRDRQIVTYCT